MEWVVVLFGPSLPGRDLVERALQRAVPVGARVVVDELRTARERRAFARGVAAAGARALFVEWTCAPEEAEKEIFHHYAATPARYADARWRAYNADRAAREPGGLEIAPRIEARAGAPLEDVVAAVTARLGGRASTEQPAQAVRVLVVEDDPGQRVLLEDAFTQLGCDVLTAASAEDAVAVASSTPLDLVVADFHLPGASGADLARALDDVQDGLHVAIVTGHPDEAVDALGRREVDAVLAKPVGIVDLIHLVDDLAPRARHHA